MIGSLLLSEVAVLSGNRFSRCVIQCRDYIVRTGGVGEYYSQHGCSARLIDVLPFAVVTALHAESSSRSLDESGWKVQSS